jgi:hypothetical protein
MMATGQEMRPIEIISRSSSWSAKAGHPRLCRRTEDKARILGRSLSFISIGNAHPPGAGRKEAHRTVNRSGQQAFASNPPRNGLHSTDATANGEKIP